MDPWTKFVLSGIYFLSTAIKYLIAIPIVFSVLGIIFPIGFNRPVLGLIFSLFLLGVCTLVSRIVKSYLSNAN